MFIDLAKLILSKDTRDSIQAAIGAIKKTPTWQADLLQVSHTFKREEQEMTDILVRFTLEILLSKGWPAERIGVAEFVVRELISNGFAHGIKNNNTGSVQVGARLTSHWAEYQVRDWNRDFNLKLALEEPANADHGLWFVRLSASALTQPSAGLILARIDRIASKHSTTDDGELVVVALKGRLEHGSVEQATALINDLRVPARVVIDLGDLEYVSSAGLRMLMILAKSKRETTFASDTLALLVPPDRKAIREILEISRFHHIAPVAATLEEARQMVDAA